MRKITYIVGLIGFAAVAMGGSRIRLDGPDINWRAEIENKDDEVERIEFKRSNTFYFEDNDPKAELIDGLPKDPDVMITQYNVSYVGGKEKLTKKAVDCRVVAKNMVEALMGHDVIANKSESNVDRETRRYKYRQDQVPSTLIARNLKTINIRKGEKPGYQCKATYVGPTKGTAWEKEKAACGELDITFKRRKSTREKYVGQYAIFFSEAACRNFSDEMGKAACETLIQVEGCGLRYVQQGLNDKRPETKKAIRDYCVADRSKYSQTNAIKAEQLCDAPTKGLAEEFADIANDELLSRYNKRYKGVMKAETDGATPVRIDDDEKIHCKGDCGLFQAPGSSVRP